MTLQVCVGVALVMLLLAVGVRVVTRPRGRWVRRVGAGLVMITLLPVLPAAGMAVFLSVVLVRGQPAAVERSLGPGVSYERRVRAAPSPWVAHIVTIDLDTGPSFFVNPPVDTPDGPRTAAATATAAIDSLDADLVVNGNFFHPFRDRWFLDYRPHAGEWTQSIGIAIGDGRRYGQDRDDFPTFHVDGNQNVGMGRPNDQTQQAVSGNRWLIRDGRIMTEPGGPTYPRSAIALDADRHTLWVVVVDGKQPRYSEGMTCHQLSELLLALGAHDAINLDGGGSSALAWRGADGKASLLNRPIHTKIPGRERPVANHLGIHIEEDR